MGVIWLFMVRGIGKCKGFGVGFCWSVVGERGVVVDEVRYGLGYGLLVIGVRR